MLTHGDDFPLHQTPEPVAFAGASRNFYDRYFFNGYSPDGSIFFALALGVYPQLDTIDASFCVQFGGTQYNLRASRPMDQERLDLSVGPIRLEILKPLNQLRIVIDDGDGRLGADATFTARHAPVEEPRFIRWQGPRLNMDYTRLTQNGTWSGSIRVAGETIELDPKVHVGTRDRSWGIRPVGATESQPPASSATPQFWWLWIPLNFPDFASFFHSNDDADGVPWNRRGVLERIGAPSEHYRGDNFELSYQPGTRRIASVSMSIRPNCQLIVTPRPQLFYMSGLGYLHPTWGHGMDHGALEVARDQLALDPVPQIGPTTIHVQALADAVLEIDGEQHTGVGVVEQLFLGAHSTSGLTGVLDAAK